MTFIKNFATLYIASSVVSMTSALESSRDLTVCDTLKACYLINIDTRKETELTGRDKLVLDPTNSRGYSIRCDGNGKDELHFIKYIYDGITFDEFGEPRYMAGDSDQGAYINTADYLSTCGLKKITVQGNVWSFPCFERDYVIEVSNSDGKPCGDEEETQPPIKSPTSAPVMKETKAPVKPKTSAPVKPQTSAPVKPQTNAPVKPQTNAPVKPQTKAPVKPQTDSPVKPPVPVRAPVLRPVSVPVPRPVPVPVPVPVLRPVPVRTPVNPDPVPVPVMAPVKPVCPSGQEWINGCCKPIQTCPSGQYWINGCCKQIPTCPSGQEWINGCCKPKPILTCPSGQYLVNGCCKAIPTCPSGQEWINGCCKAICKNDYTCPINSSRIASRECYNDFHDCECRYGYYKAFDKCVKHSWCYW